MLHTSVLFSRYAMGLSALSGFSFFSSFFLLLVVNACNRLWGSEVEDDEVGTYLPTGQTSPAFHCGESRSSRQVFRREFEAGWSIVTVDDERKKQKSGCNKPVLFFESRDIKYSSLKPLTHSLNQSIVCRKNRGSIYSSFPLPPPSPPNPSE